MKWIFSLTVRKQITLAVLILIAGTLTKVVGGAIIENFSKLSKIDKLEEDICIVKEEYKKQKDKAIALNTQICISLGNISNQLDTIQIGVDTLGRDLRDFKIRQQKYNNRLSEGNTLWQRSLEDIFNVKRQYKYGIRYTDETMIGVINNN